LETLFFPFFLLFWTAVGFQFPHPLPTIHTNSNSVHPTHFKHSLVMSIIAEQPIPQTGK
jgi:hypothetical protein